MRRFDSPELRLQRRARGVAIAAALLLLVILSVRPAHAAADLAIVAPAACLNQNVSVACAGQTYATPAATSIVRTANSLTPTWGEPGYQWALFGSLAAGAPYETCATDVAEGAPNASGICGSWHFIAKSGGLPANALPGTFTADKTSGQSPLTVKLTWSVPGAATCTASGSWTGAKTASGTLAVTNITANATYKLDCTKPAAGVNTADLSWSAPTTTTTGQPLVGALSYKVYEGASAAGVTNLLASPGTTAYTATGLSNGAHYFAVTAVLEGVLESAPTTAVSKTINVSPAASFSGSIVVSVTSAPPSPPTNLKVGADTVAYDLTKSTNKLSLVAVGEAPQGTACDATQKYNNAFYVVPRASVTLLPGKTRPTVILAKCG